MTARLELEIGSADDADVPDHAAPVGGGTSPLISHYLELQRQLTAVEEFSRVQLASEPPAPAHFYSALLPASPPGPDEQYAFEVDLDACSGCKSCVTACHTLNGLDEHETWRDVGLLHGGTAELPVIQHVTGACHHCLEPACMTVCPVKAYEKDAATGIVRHLDDQCIGCQYCTLACPYDVPKYHNQKGIVRKCDMCSGRLAVGEAPACVQACPNGAIRIAVVRNREVVENCETSVFLPGAPDPSITLPTTHYKTRRVFPRNMLPADYYSVRPEHAHLPLVVMLVLTQLSVGAFLVALVLESFASAEVLHGIAQLHAGSAVVFGLLALGASVLHLGRPLFAFRAVIGLKTSWLSREILSFGVFAVLAVAYAVMIWSGVDSNGEVGWAESSRPTIAQESASRMVGLEDSTHPTSGFARGAVAELLGIAVVMAGLCGVVCSIMIYQCTGRSFWNGSATSLRFLLTTVLLGIAATLGTSIVGAGLSRSLTVPQVMSDYGGRLLQCLAATAGLKLLFEASILRHRRDKQNTPSKRSALLLTGVLARVAGFRFALGLIGGVLLPALLVAAGAAGSDGPRGVVLGTTLAIVFAACLVGELLERYLFFTAVVVPRMPGRLVT